MEDRLKELMQELGNAINESLSDSDRIASAIGEIRRAGYDVFLILEATIGFNRREDSEEPRQECGAESSAAEPEPKASGETTIRWTSQDQKFLRALKIAVDDRDS